MGEPILEKLNQPVSASEREPNRLPPPRRFFRTFLPIFLILAATSVTAIWTLIVPKYTAKVEIRVRPIFDQPGPGYENTIPLYKTFMNTQVSTMQSPTVLQRSLDDKRVRATQWYKGYKSPLDSLWKSPVLTPMERLRNGLSVVPRQGTELIDVSFKARSAEDAVVIVDAVREQYIIHTAEMAELTHREPYRKLAEKYKSLEKEIQEHEKALIKLRGELGAGTVQGTQMLEKENEALRNKRSQFEAVRDHLEQIDMRRPPRRVPGSIEILESPSTSPDDPRVLFTILALLGSFVIGSICGLIRARIRR
jgi:uncharacterized protein involved in exopolysaccharide biosynthesis